MASSTVAVVECLHRFLQGPGTDREEIQKMRDAAREGESSLCMHFDCLTHSDLRQS